MRPRSAQRRELVRRHPDTASVRYLAPPVVTVAVALPAGEHAHVALLLSPFAYSTYRGS